MNNKRVLIIAAHPDDEILGCGGTISKLIQDGSQVFVLYLGEGSSCRYSLSEKNKIRAAIETRKISAQKAMKYLQVYEYHFEDLPCGRFDTVPIIEINKIIEGTIRKFEPDIIFTHSNIDANNDHKITFRSTIMATRPTPGNKNLSIYTFEVLTSTEWSFTDSFIPNTYISLSEKNINQKWKALSLYESEVKAYPYPRSAEGIKALAQIRGMQSGVKYAESFTLVRRLIE